MKKIVLTALFAAFGGVAQAQDSDVIRHELIWTDPATLEANLVLQCDDSAYNAVDLIIHGRAGTDFSIEMLANIGSGAPVLGCELTKRYEGRNTVYRFVPNSGCELKVTKHRVGPTEHMTAEITIDESC